MALGLVADWTARDSDDNAASAATKTAIAGQRHVVTAISAGFATTPATPKLLELKDGTTVVWSEYITVPVHREFAAAIRMSTNSAAVGALAASGTGGVISVVTIAGYSE